MIICLSRKRNAPGKRGLMAGESADGDLLLRPLHFPVGRGVLVPRPRDAGRLVTFVAPPLREFCPPATENVNHDND